VAERWKVIRYVQTLQNPEGDEVPTPETEEGAEGDAAVSEETAMNN
jgi:hypothetical protein